MTVEEMAKQLGVSKSTVSRALSGKGRISEETRERIRTFARAAGGWKENGVAPLQKATGNIAVVIPTDAYSNSIPFFQECLLGVSEAAMLTGYQAMITIGSVNDCSAVAALVEKSKVDGVVLLRSVDGDRTLKYLIETGFPTGLAGCCEHEEVIQVDTDNRAAAEKMVSLLIGQGYRRFAMVLGEMVYYVNRSRSQGCYAAMEKLGLNHDMMAFYPNFTNMELMDSIIDDMMAKRIECIICGDDVICTRLMSRLQAEGYRIPHDISIVSLYNSDTLECFSPAVTALNISARKVGYTLGKQLIAKLQGEEYVQKTTLGFELLLRKSIGKMYEV